MSDAHGEHGGDETPVCSTPCDPDCDAVCHEDHAAGHKKQHWPYDCPAAEQYFDEYFRGTDGFVAEVIKRLRAERDAATARAESATVLPERWRALIAERDAAVRRAEEAEARLAERQPIRAEWSTENAYYRPGDDVVSQELAARRVIAHPDIHTAVLRRQLYAGPWVPAAKACRSCGETDRVAGDPPLCSNCAVYGATYCGVACWPPIAAPDGRSATETAEGVSGGAFQANTSSILPQGLSEPELFADACDCECRPGQPCLCPERDCYCGPCCVCGDNPQLPDDTTEDDRG